MTQLHIAVKLLQLLFNCERFSDVLFRLSILITGQRHKSILASLPPSQLYELFCMFLTHGFLFSFFFFFSEVVVSRNSLYNAQ